MKNLREVIFSALFFLSVLHVNPVAAQQSLVYTSEDAEFHTAIELFQKEKFGAAQKSFRNVIASHKDPQSLIRVDAEFYNAVCAMELFNKDGELYLKQFIADHPESPKVKTACYYLGKYNYRKKKWRDAIEWFNKVDIYDLTTDELAELYFKRGYSYFSNNRFDEAKKDLYEIKDVDNKYAGAAKYYFAHIAYTEKNYETALTDFLKLQQNETFAPVVPFYIAQLYFLEGKYEQVISYAPPLLDSASTKRAPELARIVGESYYRTGRYKESLPFLLKYEKAVGALSRKDNYELGYIFYRLNDCDEAVNYFIKITNIDDSLEQNAFYHMGDCYVKLDNRQNARNAFGQAAKLDFDPAIKEDALFNYAKLCYELAYNPYNEAIRAFQQYIRDYPNSSRRDEAYSYLANVYTTSKNYKEALEALENIKVLTPDLRQAYQKIAYYRATDLFNNRDFAEAVKLYNKSLTYNFDKNIFALASYWKGEAFYNMQEYEKAINCYQTFISDPGSISNSEVSDVNYNIGYSFFKLKDYDNSILWFRKFVTFKPQADIKKINDALNRIADGYFVQRDFAAAVDYYGQSYKLKLINPDYALFQKAMANGVQKKYPEKISDLKTFVAAYSGTGSTFNERARFELAETYSRNGQPDQSLTEFQKFVTDFPDSKFMNTALSRIGLIYYQRKDDDNALTYFEKLIRRDRKSAEAAAAIGIIKEIYTAKGDVPGLAGYLASIGASIPQAALDSLAYSNGDRHQREGDCSSVVKDFAKYIQQFPDGIFIVPASYYKAECEYKLKDNDAAVNDFKTVISKNKNEFTESSLYRVSSILFGKQNYQEALGYYQQLEKAAEDPKNRAAAQIGIMRCSSGQKNDSLAAVYAQKVLQLEKLPPDISNEAHHIIALSYYDTQRYDEAFAEFKALSNTAKDEYGAEASYYVALILFQKNQYKESEKAVFDFVNDNGDFPFWVTKALIVLADDYAAMNDNFQAKTTLKSIISDSDIPELIKIAQDKLDKIIAAEEAAKKIKTETVPDKIEFQGDPAEKEKLFNEPTPPSPEGEKKNE